MTSLSAEQITLLTLVTEQAERLGVSTYIVGGVVRDLLRGCSIRDQDIDIMVEGNAGDLAREVARARGGVLREFPGFLTAKVVFDERSGGTIREIDFASARAESYAFPGALPSVQPATLAQDLLRRDFSINALALPLTTFLAGAGAVDHPLDPALVIDTVGGLADLRAALVRTLHPQSFTDDPTRAFRGCRYVGRLTGKFEEETEAQLRGMLARGGLGTISTFRIFSELRHLFEEECVASGFSELVRVGIVGALALVDPSEEGRLLTAVRRMDQLQEIIRASRRKAGKETPGPTAVEWGMAVLFLLSSTSAREQVWSKAQISRRERRALEELVVTAETPDPGEGLSDRALLALLAIDHPARADLTIAAQSRGLLTGSILAE